MESATATGMDAPRARRPEEPSTDLDPQTTVEDVLRAVQSTQMGLSPEEAALRLGRYGPNLLSTREVVPWWRPVLAQFVHPLAVLLIASGALSFYSDSITLGWTILGVVVLNAAFALLQKRQAERAVGALSAFLPRLVTALRSGRPVEIDIATLVPGDVLQVSEGQRISADGRVVAGEIEVDLSTLNGESVPVLRTSSPDENTQDVLTASNLVFSGTTCTAGSASVVVLRTGDDTELGRIAALTRERSVQQSPLEQQVERLAKLIAAVAVLSGLAFLPIGLAAGLSFKDSFLFATGLLVANVPEGLLPIITLALAAGASVLARRGVVVKRLSAVETLGSATTICTDKTGTLTQNRMTPVSAWTAAGDLPMASIDSADEVATTFAMALGACATANGAVEVTPGMDPTEAALLAAAQTFLAPDLTRLDTRGRQHQFPFVSATRLMSTIDRVETDPSSGPRMLVHTKGAPEVVLARCSTQLTETGTVPLTAQARAGMLHSAQQMSRRGLRVLALADRDLGAGSGWPSIREDAETGLRLLGYVALLDPPREHVAAAVRRCHDAGLRVHVVSGDSAETAAEIARQVGVGSDGIHVITGEQLDAMTDADMRTMFEPPFEVVCARSTPENKLRITGVLQAEGEVVAVTGDGVNDAPSLRRADIGIAMGAGGTDVAREAAAAVLVDNDFAALVAAVEEGRRVYDNVRKFIVFIFSHAVPEVVPFLVFALSGGAVPLPITVLQILAIDLGAETLCALALARERAEPGLMTRPPKALAEPLVTGQMLWRAWGILGITSAALTMIAFFYVLVAGGWGWGDPVGPGSALHNTYIEATTASFAAIVICQMGTAVAARTSRAALSTVGWATNRLLLVGILAGLAFAGLVIYVPLANQLIHTAPLPPDVLLVLFPFPFVVWGVDELYRAARRQSDTSPRRTSGP